MKNSKSLKAILFISGIIAVIIGGSILFMPAAFYAINSINLAGNISLLNEIRASGGALLASGLLILSGAFVNKMTFTSTLLASLLYIAYGLSRMLSFGLDGMPSDGLVEAAILEIFIGIICITAFAKYRTKQETSHHDVF